MRPRAISTRALLSCLNSAVQTALADLAALTPAKRLNEQRQMEESRQMPPLFSPGEGVQCMRLLYKLTLTLALLACLLVTPGCTNQSKAEAPPLHVPHLPVE